MKEAVLAAVPLFATLPDDEIAYLARSLPERDVPAHHVLFHEGEAGDHFFVVLQGAVAIIKALGTTGERLLGVRRAGEFVGEMSLVTPDARRTASVRTETGCRLLEISRPAFEALLQRQPTLAYQMVRVLSARLRESEDATIRDLREKNAELQRTLAELRQAQAEIVEKQALERELELAREIQESMLPSSLPPLRGFSFGARMVPARAVGGDLFDFVPLEPGRLGIVVGDVSGKGLPAALFMALTRSLVRAEASRNDAPGATLERVNHHMLAMNAGGMFVTMLYGVLDGGTGAFAYARAGHELPILVDRSGNVSMPARGSGNPLGMLDTPDLDEQTITIPAGTSLLLYTDGVTDALDPDGAFFGLERLVEALRIACSSGQAVCDQVLEIVMAHQGAAQQHDDVTLVSLQATDVP